MNKITKHKISHFINSVGNGDFAKADKHLSSIIENKLAERINNLKKIKLFKQS